MDTQAFDILEQALGSLSDDDILDILAEIDPVSWTESRRILKGQPFSFHHREYLLEPYRDEYQQVLFMKGRQVEMSEFSMNWMLRKLDAHPYTSGLHAFPRAAQALKFSKQRVEFAIKDSKYLREWNDDRNSELLMRKFIKEPDKRGLQPYNFYILGATWESRKDTVGDAARGTSLDFIAYDERQDHPNDVETVLGEGASHSEFKQTLTLGTPKLPGIQFDQQWEASDKRYWIITCKHCGRKEPITMDNILDSGDGYYYGCPKCQNPIERNIGKWESTKPYKNPEYHGYHINQLMVCWLTADEIMKKKNSVSYPRRRFHNEVLGESYGGDDVPISLAMMRACGDNQYKIGETEGTGVLYAGVDWGNKSYCWLHDRTHRVIDVHICEESDPRKHPGSIVRFLSGYRKPGINKVVCDAGPDITRFYNLRDELASAGVCHSSRVFGCYYSSPPSKGDTKWDEDKGIVTTGRSEAIEKIIDEVHDLRLVLPGMDLDVDRIDDAIDHFTNIAAEKAENSAGNAYIIYVNTGPDHFLHAKIYADLASEGVYVMPIGKQAAPVINTRTRTNISSTRKASTKKFPVFQNRRR